MNEILSHINNMIVNDKLTSGSYERGYVPADWLLADAEDEGINIGEQIGYCDIDL